MSKVKPTTKEQLVYFLMNNISLGTYDRRFLNNLQTIHFAPKNPVTSNQSELLNKIILRYARQLRKKEIDANEMVKLPWGLEPIESLPEYTDAFCTIKDGIIQVRSPYKKEFISDIKDTEIHLNWDKETKIWSAVLCEYTLKHFINCLDKHYHITHYCDQTKEYINTLADYESVTCWDPIYKKVNGNYMVAATNGPLNDALGDITMDLEPNTLAQLSSAGIKIHTEVIEDAIEELWNTDYAIKLIEFATTTNATIGIDSVPELINFLKDIKCDYVLIAESYVNLGSKTVPLITELLIQNNIKYSHISARKSDSRDIDAIDTKQYKYPVIINTGLWGSNKMKDIHAAKQIFLGNNTPINVI